MWPNKIIYYILQFCSYVNQSAINTFFDYWKTSMTCGSNERHDMLLFIHFQDGVYLLGWFGLGKV